MPFGYLMSDGILSVDSRHYSEKHNNRPRLGHLIHLAISYRLISDGELRKIHDEIAAALAE